MSNAEPEHVPEPEHMPDPSKAKPRGKKAPKVDVEDIAKGLGRGDSNGASRPVPQTHSEGAITIMAYCAGGAVIVFVLFILGEWAWTSRSFPPYLPADPKLADVEAIQRIVTLNKSLSDLATDRSIRIFNTIVAKAAIPTCTPLVGTKVRAKGL